MSSSILWHRIFKKKTTPTQRLNFNKLTNFHYFIKDILGKCLFLACVQMKTTIGANMVWCHCLDWHQCASTFNHCCFCAPNASVQKVKRANNVKALLWTNYYHGDPLKGSLTPPMMWKAHFENPCPTPLPQGESRQRPQNQHQQALDQLMSLQCKYMLWNESSS